MGFNKSSRISLFSKVSQIFETEEGLISGDENQ